MGIHDSMRTSTDHSGLNNDLTSMGDRNPSLDSINESDITPTLRQYPLPKLGIDQTVATSLGNLESIPLPKDIFISRLKASTIPSDVLSYIGLNKGLKIDGFDCVKVSKPNSLVSSFKLKTPIDYFKTVCSVAFWPEHTFVKEFIRKTRSKNRSPPHLSAVINTHNVGADTSLNQLNGEAVKVIDHTVSAPKNPTTLPSTIIM